MRLMRSHTWPGNVRELFSVVESAAIRASGPRIEAQHLPAPIRDPEGRGAAPGMEERYRAGDPESEREAIVVALTEANGSRSRAADLLGMSRTTLWRRMKEFGLGDDE
jgi:transcriptional regulator of acetoin/glycerol metabolism